ncbi:glutathione S-transferase [Chromobacterium subtsugae]|uniref:Glutathione S-transferase n=1 Tax=Chromobacterium subtsugae TaxID=251747 RepID=A0ABS7FJ22_9NEIS|nr:MULTISPECIES: glutathione S-transferase [Chromobacterium]KUM05694.1 glutathione S-transferase [Chromobacterium subtsugae]KZE84606.1 glutathione S-transferase [Chromobacterium sp. F49]MBW7568188.1 glutathione S-transferase [Chromobacterium subtsugae]MBW8289299.1 glutathione S-transferase [Chromobacterium subtsugae]WSE90383.1 glutathione S-transferase [Chromobacterium subtsugae]
MSAIQLYDFPLSGHSHRARLMLSLLGLEYEAILVNLAAGEHKQPAYLKRNRFGQVPVLVDGDAVIADSNAILVYLARRYGHGDWIPADPAAEAQVQRWLSAAAGPLAFGAAQARLHKWRGVPLDYPLAVSRAEALLQVMEQELAERPFLAGQAATIADVALYTYTAHAPEGEIPLAPYPHVRAWLARVEALPGFVAMPANTAS